MCEDSVTDQVRFFGKWVWSVKKGVFVSCVVGGFGQIDDPFVASPLLVFSEVGNSMPGSVALAIEPTRPKVGFLVDRGSIVGSVKGGGPSKENGTALFVVKLAKPVEAPSGVLVGSCGGWADPEFAHAGLTTIS